MTKDLEQRRDQKRIKSAVTIARISTAVDYFSLFLSLIAFKVQGCSPLIFKVQDTWCTPIFFDIFTKGNNFCDILFAFLDKEALSKLNLVVKERICSMGANSFL